MYFAMENLVIHIATLRSVAESKKSPILVVSKASGAVGSGSKSQEDAESSYREIRVRKKKYGNEAGSRCLKPGFQLAQTSRSVIEARRFHRENPRRQILPGVVEVPQFSMSFLWLS
jgi:hypothetical protein